MKKSWLLTKNELIKILSKPRNYIFVGVIIICLIASIFIQYKEYRTSLDEDWKSNISTQIDKDKKELDQLQEEEGVPDSYKELVTKDIELNEYRIQHNIPPNQYNVWEFIQSNNFLLLLIMIFSIILASGIVSYEYNKGTIKLLLVRPYKRWKILLSKYLAINLYASALVLLYILISFISGLLIFGGFSAFQLEYVKMAGNGEIISYTVGENLFKNIGLQYIQLIVFITIAFMISTIFKNSTIATAISLMTFFGGSIIVNMISKLPLLKYSLFAHLNLTQFTVEEQSEAGFRFSDSLLILFLYWLLMMISAFFIFEKRDVRT